MTGYKKNIHRRTAAAFLAAMFFLAGCASDKNGRPFLEKKAAGLEAAGADAYGGGDYGASLRKFSEALAANRSVDNRAGELSDLINIGRVLILLGDYGSSVSYLNEAITLAAGIKDDANLSEARATLAKAHYSSGNGAMAADEIDAALAIDERLGAVSGAKLNLKASILMDTGRAIEAKELLKKALKNSESADDITEAANALRLLAGIESAEGTDGSAALKLYERAYELDKTLGNPFKIAVDLKNMAALNLRAGRVNDAAFLFERHYTAAKTIGLLAEAVLSIEELIKIYTASGDGKKASEYIILKDSLIQAQGARISNAEK